MSGTRGEEDGKEDACARACSPSLPIPNLVASRKLQRYGPPSRMSTTYKHKQFGLAMIVGLIAAMLITLGSYLAIGAPLVGSLVPATLLGVCAVLFSTLTAEVDSQHVRCYFGLGLIRRTIPLGEIQAVRAVRNSFANGWGIRFIPGGWLWNVSGLDAVELTFRDGRLFRIGTDQPAELLRAIEDNLGPA